MSHPEQGRPAAPAARGSFLITRAADSLVARLSRGRIYYGWYIVAAIFALETTTMGFNGLFFGIFLKPMSQEFGWTRAMTTGAVTAGTLAAATIGLFVGWVLDRYGPRWMITGGCVLLGASYFGLSRVNTILAFYLAYAVGRSLFQSALGRNMLNALTAKWFVRRRAIAIAFSSLGGILGGTVMAPVIQEIINRYGWREAWAFLGFLALSVAFLPSLLLLRRIPEDLGLRPDGDGRVETLPPGRQASSLGAVQAGKGIRILGVALRAPGATLAESNLTLPEAVRTPAFWLLCLVIAINVMATTGVTFHMVPHFTDIGI
ncbi:MAG: MFS transporter, partial [Chloroflexi bacterium]|nr:MFS transporter [Chloroflexota bacterium]